jgi:diguanylate cyclase (GGDEF)-like protein
VKVLIAEDDTASRLILQRLLARLGHEVRAAEDGSKAWSLAQEDPPDVLISDWMMPGLDGIELCSLLRSEARGTQGYVYIIIVTALEDREHLLFAMEAGADDYLAKPLDPSDLSVRLRVAERVTALYRQIAVQHQQLEQLNQELHAEARHDALTGLPNRVLFQDRLEQALRTAARNDGPLSLLLVDLDGFKAINDTLGHKAGDLLLQAVATRMQQQVRTSDTVARLGGDEFAVLLPQTGEHGALRVAAKIRAALAETVALGDRTGQVGASIGIALYPEHAADPVALKHCADLGMYAAKGGGYGVYTPDYAVGAVSPQGLGADLHRAIAAGEIRLLYQPVLTCQTGRVERVEVLAHWLHPHHGPLPPSRFIRLAEHAGLMTSLTVRVLEDALRQHQAWRHQGLGLGVSVNVAALSLEELQFPDLVAALLRQYGVPASDLTLELTESALMAQPVRALGTLDALAKLGVRLSIDSFGTGHSSISQLRRLPVQELKLDLDFVTDLENLKSTNLPAFLVGLGIALGITVVVKGVETQKTWDSLQQVECEAVQGFFVCRPLPAAELRDWLRGGLWHADMIGA